MAKILKYLKKTYHTPKTELKYATPFQLAVAVILSAQCTDKFVNKVTKTLKNTNRRRISQMPCTRSL